MAGQLVALSPGGEQRARFETGTRANYLVPPRPGPVFVESLNQIGVAKDGVFLRRDLRPPGDATFWQGGNPNSGGGVWKSPNSARRAPSAVCMPRA